MAARDLSVPVRQFTVARLATDLAVAALAGSRVYGPSEPDNPVWPFVRMDLPDVVPESDGCGGGTRYGFNVHAFAKGDDERSVGQLAAAISAALDDTSAQITGVVPDAWVQDMLWRGTEIRRDIDEVNGWHAVVRMSVLVSG